jgi:hypothetical protein
MENAKTSGQIHLFNIWTIRAIRAKHRTPGQPQVKTEPTIAQYFFLKLDHYPLPSCIPHYIAYQARSLHGPLPRTTLYKKVSGFPVPSRDVAYRTLLGREYLNYSLLGTGKTANLFLQCTTCHSTKYDIMLCISSQTSMKGFQASRETCSSSVRATRSSRNKKFLLFLLFWRLFWSFLEPIRIWFRIRIHALTQYILIPSGFGYVHMYQRHHICTVNCHYRTVYFIAKSVTPLGNSARFSVVRVISACTAKSENRMCTVHPPSYLHSYLPSTSRLCPHPSTAYSGRHIYTWTKELQRHQSLNVVFTGHFCLGRCSNL